MWVLNNFGYTKSEKFFACQTESHKRMTTMQMKKEMKKAHVVTVADRDDNKEYSN